jgi:hypothetical protein
MNGNEKEINLDLDLDVFGPPLEKYGIFLFMDTITDLSCKEAVEFIIKQNLGKSKLKHLKIIICSNGGDISPTFEHIIIFRCFSFDFPKFCFMINSTASLHDKSVIVSINKKIPYFSKGGPKTSKSKSKFISFSFPFIIFH